MKMVKELAWRTSGGEWNLVYTEDEMLEKVQEFTEIGLEVEFGEVGGFEVSESELRKIKNEMGGVFNSGVFDHEVKDFDIIKDGAYPSRRTLLVKDEAEAERTEIPYDTDIA